MDWESLLRGYLISINLFSFIVMAIDKIKAKHGSWRVPEKSLMILAVAGGSLGMLLGMYVIRHKTKKLKFSLGVPVILCLQVLVAVFLLKNI